ncbi:MULTISPECIES: LytR/AlgR family response regulator transcription factor [Pontibacillus]|uniref:LytTR family DNA-binding domain-containing protein n=1 Tax=Pontibacillus chungwhensis TaxID=265426 RepID=A0ABY8UUJ1_9BACI|nr:MULTISPECIES: LytTR family DNA-binding domain-containing protein [Pontibacillus]MCD5325084.1 LytTR family DNA-binding domain-containing protein [Pontibacillus sp. HN14]WIF97335.1 LytTR family DNA-binding domain-containing protein [Pontibacillus chungwhensis]
MGKRITAVVVDDERFSREELIYLLKEHERIEIIGEADSGEDAVMKALQLQPDVLFLDIEMPKMNGLEVAESLQELKKVPDIVFATAYPDFAVEAFRHEAVDYILKPFEEEPIRETVDRLERRLLNEGSAEKGTIPSKLAVEEEEEITYLTPSEIMYVYRDGRVTKIVDQTRTYETKRSLKEVEQRLEPFSFFRIHKSYLVNLQYVKRLVPWFNGAYHLELRGRDEQLSVSRNYVKELRKQLEL